MAVLQTKIDLVSADVVPEVKGTLMLPSTLFFKLIFADRSKVRFGEEVSNILNTALQIEPERRYVIKLYNDKYFQSILDPKINRHVASPTKDSSQNKKKPLGDSIGKVRCVDDNGDPCSRDNQFRKIDLVGMKKPNCTPPRDNCSHTASQFARKRYVLKFAPYDELVGNEFKHLPKYIYQPMFPHDQAYNLPTKFSNARRRKRNNSLGTKKKDTLTNKSSIPTAEKGYLDRSVSWLDSALNGNLFRANDNLVTPKPAQFVVSRGVTQASPQTTASKKHEEPSFVTPLEGIVFPKLSDLVLKSDFYTHAPASMSTTERNNQATPHGEDSKTSPVQRPTNNHPTTIATISYTTKENPLAWEDSFLQGVYKVKKTSERPEYGGKDGDRGSKKADKRCTGNCKSSSNITNEVRILVRSALNNANISETTIVKNIEYHLNETLCLLQMLLQAVATAAPDAAQSASKPAQCETAAPITVQKPTETTYNITAPFPPADLHLNTPSTSSTGALSLSPVPSVNPSVVQAMLPNSRSTVLPELIRIYAKMLQSKSPTDTPEQTQGSSAAAAFKNPETSAVKIEAATVNSAVQTSPSSFSLINCQNTTQVTVASDEQVNVSNVSSKQVLTSGQRDASKLWLESEQNQNAMKTSPDKRKIPGEEQNNADTFAELQKDLSLIQELESVLNSLRENDKQVAREAKARSSESEPTTPCAHSSTQTITGNLSNASLGEVIMKASNIVLENESHIHLPQLDLKSNELMENPLTANDNSPESSKLRLTQINDLLNNIHNTFGGKILQQRNIENNAFETSEHRIKRKNPCDTNSTSTRTTSTTTTTTTSEKQGTSNGSCSGETTTLSASTIEGINFPKVDLKTNRLYQNPADKDATQPKTKRFLFSKRRKKKGKKKKRIWKKLFGRDSDQQPFLGRFPQNFQSTMRTAT